MRRSFPAALAACFLATSAHGQYDRGDIAPPAVEYDWTIRNDCKLTVSVAVRYADEWGIRTRGWWRLDRSEDVTFRVHGADVYWYAKSGNLIWSGREADGFEVSISLTRRFNYEGDEAPARVADLVSMKWEQAREDMTTRITCTQQ